MPFSCSLELHAQYGRANIFAALGQNTLERSIPSREGVLHIPSKKIYVLMITYQKTEKEFSPSTMYADYPISRDLLHWESQSNIAQHTSTGQNLIYHQQHGYTILILAVMLQNEISALSHSPILDQRRESVTKASGQSRWYGDYSTKCLLKCLRIIEGVVDERVRKRKNGLPLPRCF